MKQLALFKESTPKVFGGQLLQGKRKTLRPLHTKLALHIVLRAELTKGQDLCREIDTIHKLLGKYATKFHIRIYDDAIVFNHIHLIVKIPNRLAYLNFIRAFTGGVSAQLGIKWAHRPFTRVVEWGKDFQRAKGYVRQNHLEAAGMIAYTPRKVALKGR